MNDLDYLNQISAKPGSSQKAGGFFDKKTKLIAIIIGAVLLMSIVLMMVMSSSPQPTASDELNNIYQRSNSLEETVRKYTKYLKSSSLRSSAAALDSLLTNAKSTSETLLQSKYGVKPGKNPSAEDTKTIEELNTTLEKARLNGILDRSFAHELYYQIEFLLIMEQSASRKVSSTGEVYQFLDSSYKSLAHISDTLKTFSEAD